MDVRGFKAAAYKHTARHHKLLAGLAKCLHLSQAPWGKTHAKNERLGTGLTVILPPSLTCDSMRRSNQKSGPKTQCN